jgi:8-oxo-dGTP pyrophosphatase MutT (NUDIX family)
MTAIPTFENFNITQNGSVSILVVNSKEQILLLQKSMHGQEGEGKWDLPGGEIDSPDIIVVAKRKLLEEAGIIADSLDFMEVQDYITKSTGIAKKRYVFITQSDDEVTTTPEHMWYKWLSLKDAVTFDFYHEQLKELIGKL